MTAIATARTSHVLTELNLCAAARKAGWSNPSILRPDELLCGVMQLPLAGRPIPVRMVVNTGDDTAPLLARLHEDIQQSFALEEFVLMVDFTPEAVRAYRALFQRVTTKRITVGAPPDFVAWLQARLGPLARLPATSFVRRLTEKMLLVNAAPEPMERRKLVGNYSGSKIETSFNFGRDGVQAVETLLACTHARDGAVRNVEKDPIYQEAGVDLLVEIEPGSAVIKADVKCEDYDKNLSLEDISRLFKPGCPENTKDFARPPRVCAACSEKRGFKVFGKPGWSHTSEMDVLCTLFAPTGELFVIDFEEVKAWALANEGRLIHTDGWSPGQSYKSHVWLAPANLLLTELTGIVRIRIADWLPTLYAGAFENRTNVEDHLLRRTLRPQPRLVLPG